MLTPHTDQPGRGRAAATEPLSRRRRVTVLLICCMSLLIVGMDNTIVNVALPAIGHDFHATVAGLQWTVDAYVVVLASLLMLAGSMADRYGRRRPLMVNVLFFSAIELLCGFAPNYAVFFILRMLFGIGMGGEWGVGASLAMEHAPVRWRGVLSGILQSGYSVGYLLAALAARLVLPNWGWRAMFWVGGVPALLALYIRTKVPESEAWKQHRVARTIDGPRIAWQHKWLSLYLVALMFLMNCLSHGTQDLYPDFLKHAHGVAANTVAYIAMSYNVGAVVGAVIFGLLSERIGRRYSMLAALAVTLAVIPAWAFGSTLAVLACGAFVMQMGVQGAWGIIPVHLNELSPDAVRGLLPGFTYQVGILFASATPRVEFALRDHLGYAWALTAFELVVIAALSLMLVLGSEKRGRSFMRQPDEVAG